MLFLTCSALVANPKKTTYTVANPARGLLNRGEIYIYIYLCVDRCSACSIDFLLVLETLLVSLYYTVLYSTGPLVRNVSARKSGSNY